VGTIELAGVTRRFGELTAVDDVTLDVEDGEIVGLLGHNGAGKTTMIRVINGLLSPDAGRSASSATTRPPTASSSADRPAC
jgi:ABC-type multidrug transport system ATPase subunit